MLLTALSATILSGCGPGYDTRRCVDQNNILLPDQACQNGRPYAGAIGMIYPRWVYNPRGGTAIGSKVTGFRGSPTPGAGIKNGSGGVVSSPTVTRGGFGSSSSGASRGFSFGS